MQNIGNVYYEQGLYIKSLKFINEAMQLSVELGNKIQLINIYKKISDVYSMLGNYKQAYISLLAYKDLKDSIFSVDQSKELGRIEAKRTLELKDQHIIIQNLKIAQQKYEQLFMFGGIGLLIGLIGFIAYQRRKSEKPAFEHST